MWVDDLLALPAISHAHNHRTIFTPRSTMTVDALEDATIGERMEEEYTTN